MAQKQKKEREQRKLLKKGFRAARRKTRKANRSDREARRAKNPGKSITMSGRERGSGQYYDKISNTWKSPKLTFEVRAKRREGKLQKKQGKLDNYLAPLIEKDEVREAGLNYREIGANKFNRLSKKRDLMANKLRSSTKKANRIRLMREFEKTFGAKLRERKKLGIDKYFKSEYAKRKASYGGIKAIRDVTRRARKSIRSAFKRSFK
tara:strand:- start:477 stop:1097 length:621 start_codon:yes stop_codon:yes gene_type:complete